MICWFTLACEKLLGPHCLKALLAGKPVVSYDIDGAREVTISEQTGFLFPAICRL